MPLGGPIPNVGSEGSGSGASLQLGFHSPDLISTPSTTPFEEGRPGDDIEDPGEGPSSQPPGQQRGAGLFGAGDFASQEGGPVSFPSPIPILESSEEDEDEESDDDDFRPSSETRPSTRVPRTSSPSDGQGRSQSSGGPQWRPWFGGPQLRHRGDRGPLRREEQGHPGPRDGSPEPRAGAPELRRGGARRPPHHEEQGDPQPRAGAPGAARGEEQEPQEQNQGQEAGPQQRGPRRLYPRYPKPHQPPGQPVPQKYRSQLRYYEEHLNPDHALAGEGPFEHGVLIICLCPEKLFRCLRCLNFFSGTRCGGINCLPWTGREGREPPIQFCFPVYTQSAEAAAAVAAVVMQHDRERGRGAAPFRTSIMTFSDPILQ